MVLIVISTKTSWSNRADASQYLDVDWREVGGHGKVAARGTGAKKRAATATMARLRKAKLGQPMAAGTAMPKPQSLTGRLLLARATIWTRAFWDWRRPSARRYSEAFCGSTGAHSGIGEGRRYGAIQRH